MNSLEKRIYNNITSFRGVTVKFEQDKLPYVLQHHYKPDFTVKKGTKIIYIEAKGYLRYEDQRKMRAVKSCNPKADIRFVFQKDNKVQGSRLTCSEWCQKYGFKFAIGNPPKSWFRQRTNTRKKHKDNAKNNSSNPRPSRKPEAQQLAGIVRGQADQGSQAGHSGEPG